MKMTHKLSERIAKLSKPSKKITGLSKNHLELFNLVKQTTAHLLKTNTLAEAKIKIYNILTLENENIENDNILEAYKQLRDLQK